MMIYGRCCGRTNAVVDSKALWLVFRFNLFCPLRSSYARVPVLRKAARHGFPAVHDGELYG